MTCAQLCRLSPLGCIGMFLLGGVFSAQFGMAAVYGAEAGLSVAQISLFVATFYVGAMVLQYPIGWVSDRMDRRLLIVITSAIGGAGSIVGMLFGHVFLILLVSAFVVGGMSNPLYSLLIAYTNDFLRARRHGRRLGRDDLHQRAGRHPGADDHRLDDGHALGPGGFSCSSPCSYAALAVYAAYRDAAPPRLAVDETG